MDRVASLTEILKHPKVRDAAAANIIVAGIRKLFHDPDLDAYLQQEAAQDHTLAYCLEQDDVPKVGKTSPRWSGIFQGNDANHQGHSIRGRTSSSSKRFGDK